LPTALVTAPAAPLTVPTGSLTGRAPPEPEAEPPEPELPELPEPPDGADPPPDGARCPGARDTGPEANDPRRPPAASPAWLAARAPPAVAEAVVSADTTAWLGAEAPVAGAETFTATGDEGAPTCGQPVKETIALAIKNSTAAPPSSDPVVPKPARYARLARTSALNRPLCTKPLALSRKEFSAVPRPSAVDATPDVRTSCAFLHDFVNSSANISCDGTLKVIRP
jgi:hypothetical protein